MSAQKIVTLILGIVFLLVAVFLGGKMFETNMAGFYQVKQAAISGGMSCRFEPGMYWQGFGEITTYPEADTYYFTKDGDSGEDRDQSLPTQFNDGTKAYISGSLRVLWPSNCDDLLRVHGKFKATESIMKKLVEPAVRKALLMTGPHMTAAESYAERRAEFVALVEDQLKWGIVLTGQKTRKEVDPLTKEEKNVVVLTKRTCTGDDSDKDMSQVRCIAGYYRQPSAFEEFSIDVTNFVIDEFSYPPEVGEQIEVQRKARMNVITQQAQAAEADARASKAEAEGRAKVAETSATEQVAKTEKVVRAEASKAEATLLAEKQEQELIIAARARAQAAELNSKAAEWDRQADILRGEGESSRAQMRMQADGALKLRLDAWLKAQHYYAAALANARSGSLVPQVVMGGGSGGASGAGSGQALIDMLSVKTARELALELSFNGEASKANLTIPDRPEPSSTLPQLTLPPMPNAESSANEDEKGDVVAPAPAAKPAPAAAPSQDAGAATQGGAPAP